MKPIQSIAVGYDGSSDATVAVRWALHAAHEFGATVSIVHATGLLEHLRARFSPDELPPALTVLAKECAFEESRIRWLIEDGDACSVLLRMASAPINARLRQLAVFDHYFRPCPHTGQQPGKIADGFRFRYVNHPVGHEAIIPSLSIRSNPYSHRIVLPRPKEAARIFILHRRTSRYYASDRA